MLYKHFKGNSISTLGLGELRFPMEKDNPSRIYRMEAQKVIDADISCGINYFDTAFPIKTVIPNGFSVKPCLNI